MTTPKPITAASLAEAFFEVDAKLENAMLDDTGRYHAYAEAVLELVERAQWRDISSAPKDGTLVDLSCVSPSDDDASLLRIRLTDCAWHEANAIFPHTGWTRVTDDGNWDLVESVPMCHLGLPPWKPTHWSRALSPTTEPTRQGNEP